MRRLIYTALLAIALVPAGLGLGHAHASPGPPGSTAAVEMGAQVPARGAQVVMQDRPRTPSISDIAARYVRSSLWKAAEAVVAVAKDVLTSAAAVRFAEAFILLAVFLAAFGVAARRRH